MDFEIWIKSLNSTLPDPDDPSKATPDLTIGLLQEFKSTISEQRLIPHHNPKTIFTNLQQLFFTTGHPGIIAEL
jgi:hypothetical protein